MTHEICPASELKLQPLLTGRESKKSKGMDIGEVEVIRTIFGRARVRNIQRKGNVRRALLLTVGAILAIFAVKGIFWQDEAADQQADIQQDAVVEPALSASSTAEAPATGPSATPQQNTAPAEISKLAIPPQTETGRAPIAQKPVAQKPIAQKSVPPRLPVEVPEPVIAKPAAVQPYSPPKPQAEHPVTATPPAPAAAVTYAPKPPAASSPATDVPPAAKALPQAVTSGVAASAPPITKAPSPVPSPGFAMPGTSTTVTPAIQKTPSSGVATTGSPAVAAPPVAEPPSAQSATSVVQQEMPASEPGKGD